MQIKTMEYKKVIFSLILGIFLISLTSALTYVDRCMDLTIAGEYYQQNASIVNNSISQIGCIVINSPNITYDGNGFYVFMNQSFKNGLYINSSDSIIKNSNISTIGSLLTAALYINIQNNTIIKDSKFLSNSLADIRLQSSSINITVINSSYTLNKEAVLGISTLYRKWYFNAQANSTLNNLPIANVNVSARDNTNALIFSVLTNSNGYIPTQELTEYVNNGGTRTYYSNYTINATRGLVTQSSSLNLTDNSFVQFLFSRRPQFQIADGKLALFDGKLILSS